LGVALLVSTASALGQTPPPPPQPTPSAQSSEDAAEQRIRALQAQLRITDAQTPLWNTFTQAMRDNAKSTDSMFRQRASTAPSMTALDNMRSYAQVARAYADNTEKLASAFEAFYGTLSDQQKQTIDTLFRQQPAQNTAAQPAKR
jgi:hypothetical protein